MHHRVPIDLLMWPFGLESTPLYRARVHNTRHVVAIHVKTREDQEKLCPYKEQIIAVAKCQAVDVTQKWDTYFSEELRPDTET